MKTRHSARKYAKVLFEAAKKKSAVGMVQNDLAGILHSFRLNEKPWGTLQNPLVAEVEKNQAINAAFGPHLEPLMVKLLELLAAKQELRLLDAVTENINSLADDAAGIARAQVRSAYALTSEQEKALTDRLKAMTGRKVVLEQKVDPELIAGVSIKLGDRVFDHNLKIELRQLEELLTS